MKFFQTIKNSLKKVLPSPAQSVNKMNDSLHSSIYSLSNGFPRRFLQFEVHITEHCNLNCKSCEHFSSIAKPEFANIDEYGKDFSRLSKLLNGKCDNIHIMGGEPLLHRDINQFFDISRKYFPDTRLDLVTNGILLPKMGDSFWQSCRKNNIFIRPTKYPIKVDYDQIESLSQQHHVQFKYYNDGQRMKTLWHEPLDINGFQDYKHSFFTCNKANRCIFFSHGKLYTCFKIGNIHHFNNFFNTQIPVTNDDYIDIYKVDNAEEIFQFLAQPVPFCRFCDNGNITYNHKWERTNKDIKEWVL